MSERYAGYAISVSLYEDGLGDTTGADVAASMVTFAGLVVQAVEAAYPGAVCQTFCGEAGEPVVSVETENGELESAREYQDFCQDVDNIVENIFGAGDFWVAEQEVGND